MYRIVAGALVAIAGTFYGMAACKFQLFPYPEVRSWYEGHLKPIPAEYLATPEHYTRTDVAGLISIQRPADIEQKRQALITVLWGVPGLPDALRFLFPYNVLPRRWRSSLFAHNAGAPTRTVCSTLLAQAFSSVRYPVLPVLREGSDGSIQLQRRNFKLFTPGDFDYSPYFDVIKYPVMSFDDLAVYHRLPWDESAVLANAPGDEIVVSAPNPDVEPAESGSATVSRTTTNTEPSEDTRERSSG